MKPCVNKVEYLKILLLILKLLAVKLEEKPWFEKLFTKSCSGSSWK